VTKPGEPSALRFVFEDPSPGFEDALCGRYPEGRAGGDFVLRRADGIWAYQLAVVVDDAEAGISEVIRGADLLDSTSRQIALYRALGYPAPSFAHVGLVVDATGRRLATRHGARSIDSFRRAGRSAEAVIGQLAFSLGLTTNDEPIRPEELIPRFELTKISRSSLVSEPWG
jgi:glutamyl-tRNA synthetase